MKMCLEYYRLGFPGLLYRLVLLGFPEFQSLLLPVSLVYQCRLHLVSLGFQFLLLLGFPVFQSQLFLGCLE
jgi:hypothetical protein